MTFKSLSRSLAPFVILATGCSWTTDFVIVNATKSTVGVVYRFKTANSERASQVNFLPPQEVPATDINSGSWQSVAATRNNSDSSIILQLAPGQALRIASVPGYTDPTLENWRNFPLERIEIASAAGKLCHQGAAILLAFDGDHRRQVLIFTGALDQLHLNSC